MILKNSVNMLDQTAQKLRRAMSLPSILLDVEAEESERLVIGDNPEFKAGQDKKEKRKWYSRLPNPGHLLTPLRNSLLKFKRRHDHYEDASNEDENGNVERARKTNNDDECDVNTKKSASDYDITYVDSKTNTVETGIAKDDRLSNVIDVDVNSKHLSFNEHIGEARALAHGRVTVKDVFCGRYRKL